MQTCGKHAANMQQTCRVSAPVLDKRRLHVLGRIIQTCHLLSSVGAVAVVLQCCIPALLEPVVFTLRDAVRVRLELDDQAGEDCLLRGDGRDQHFRANCDVGVARLQTRDATRYPNLQGTRSNKPCHQMNHQTTKQEQQAPDTEHTALHSTTPQSRAASTGHRAHCIAQHNTAQSIANRAPCTTEHLYYRAQHTWRTVCLTALASSRVAHIAMLRKSATNLSFAACSWV